MQIEQHRHLVDRGGLIARLCLPDEKVQHLIDTRQLQSLRVAGEERFDSLDIDLLIDTYKTTASRRPQ